MYKISESDCTNDAFQQTHFYHRQFVRPLIMIGPSYSITGSAVMCLGVVIKAGIEWIRMGCVPSQKQLFLHTVT